MSRTVDLVVVGSGRAGLQAALTAAGRGERVLIVMGPSDETSLGRVRRCIRSAGGAARRRMAMLTGVELVCVDGVGGVEAVVVRRLGTSRLLAFNTRSVIAVECTHLGDTRGGARE